MGLSLGMRTLGLRFWFAVGPLTLEVPGTQLGSGSKFNNMLGPHIMVSISDSYEIYEEF